MNKPQIVWLITRLIGVYFAYWAIIAALSLFGAIYGYFSPTSASISNNSNTAVNANRTSAATPRPQTPGIPTPKTPEEREAEKAVEKLKSEAGKEIFWQLFLTLTYGAVAFYLIKNGKHLFAVLNREEAVGESNEFPASTPPSRKNDEVVTSSGIPSKKEEVTSLNLSEYVPKSRQPEPPEVKVEKTETPEVKIEETKLPESLSEQPQREISDLNDERNFLELPPEITSPAVEQHPADISPPTTEQTTANEQIEPPLNEQTWKNPEISLPKEEVIRSEAAQVSEPSNISDDDLLIIEQSAPETNEQPNDLPAPFDVSADAPSDEKK